MKNNILKSIFLTILLLLGASHAAWGNAEWLSEGGIKLYFTTDQGEKTVSFNSTSTEVNLGNCSTLKLTKVECKLRKDNSGNICSASIGYKINETQKSINCDKWDNSSSDGYTYQTISAENLNINLLEGLSQGQTHTIQLWGFAKVNTSSSGNCSGDSYYGNNGNNHKIKFTYPATWQIKGNLDGNNWPLHSFVNIDANKGSYIYSGLTANQTYEFVVVPPTNNGDFKACGITELSKAYTLVQNGQNNATFTPPYAGAYMFIWDYNLHTMTVEYLGTDQCNLLYEENDETSVYTAKEMHNTSPMQYDRATSSYYIDITTTKKFLSYRYQKAGHSTMYAANWTNAEQHIGTEVVANGAKVDANQDVSNWDSKSVCYYKGTSGDNIRIWIDYSNKKTWITKKASSYTVTFNTNGHGNEVAAQNVTSGGNATEPTAPTAAGFTFGGWYTNADCTGNKYDFANTTVTGNITLYAKWTENKYTVTISAGEGGSASPQSVSVGITTGATITATPKTGYDFGNWTASTNQIAIADINAATTTVTATAAGTVTANFKKTIYTVTFDANGHGTAPQAQNVTSGEKATEPAAPTATGYIFGGWYTEAECTHKYDFSTAVTKNITLYAKWTEDYSTKEFWYFDQNNARNSDGNTWPEIEGKGLVDKWKMTNTPTYAYIFVDNKEANNKFKIGSVNWKVDDHLIANDQNIAKADALLGETTNRITLGNVENESWHNIGVKDHSGSYYVVLYYPNVAPNTENKYQVAAMKNLPNMEKYPLTFGVIGENGNLTAKSGGVSISSGDKVATVTLTAEPAENYKVAGWYSNAEGTHKIDAAGTNTIYNLTLTAATSVYVKFKRIEKTYWYNGSDKGWTKGSSVALTNDESGVYAYYPHDAHPSDEVQFCIFEKNSWDDYTPKYNGNHKNNGFYGANIDLGTAGDGNAIVPNQSNNYFIILYFPNTTINPNDNYILCASTKRPELTDPVTVSFGVVGKTGGSLIAKSGNSTIESGTAVSYVTFTATPIAGYVVEGWYSDAEGTQKINTAGTNTTYTLSPVTESNCNVYVKFTTVRSIYFKNNHNWSEVHVYTFTNKPFDGDLNGKDEGANDDAHKKGVGPKQALEQAQMTHIGDGVYVYQLTKADQFSFVAFTEKNQYDYNNFYDYNKVVYREDHSEALSMYIPDKWEKAKWVNLNKADYDRRADYYYEGIWMKPNSKDAGYEISIKPAGGTHNKAYFTTSSIGGYDFSYDTVLTEGTTYSFFIKNDNNTYFGRGNNAIGGNAIKGTTKGWEMYAWGSGDVGEVSVTPAITGTYTFTIHLGDGKVLIDVIYPENEYRLVYVEKKGDNTEKYHPSHVIKQRAGGTEKAPLYDTISMHVRPKIRTWNETKNKYDDPTANSNTCEVQLQKREAGESTWTKLETINANTQFTESGVYNFVLKQVDGEEVTLPTELIHPYTGQYYILTDAFDSNWSLTAARDNIKQRFWYSNYADNKESFSHYCCKWTTQNTNLEFVVANDYSYCITDTLIRTEYEATHNYVNEKGELNENANVRFMWQHYDNTTDRAYVGAGGSAVKLISTNSQIKEGAELNLDDQQNWVYAKDVHAKINTRVKIEAFYHDYTQYFKGKEGDFNDEANTEYLIKGIDTSEPYKIRVIYDFKTNHLICAWMPEGEISGGDQVIESDIMLIRKDTCDATQITFNNAKLQSVKTAYGVVELTKAYLENTNYTSKARANYWISFPFDVNLSDVFGNGTYGTHFGVQYYDGAERAEKGQWVDSPTRWKFYKDPTNVVLKKGLGYVLVVLPDKLLNEQFTHGNSSIRFYFPSTNTKPIDIDGTVQEVTVPEHKCTITRNDRYIYDSNWNIIGVPTWANRDDMDNPKKAVPMGKWAEQGFKVGFYYKANTSDGTFEASEATELSFQSMYAYLVQWAGTINWQEKSYKGNVYPNSPAQQALQARRNAAAEEGEEELSAPEQYTLRLTLHRGEQQLDHTYVRLQEGNVTTDFDLNYDMTKIINSGANIYSLVGTQRIQCAANVQPLQVEAQTISIPLGVVADQDGLYTFSLPEGTEGMNVSIADSETGTVHNLALGDYQTALTAGTYEGRFALEIQPRQEVSTGCEQTDAAGKSLRKVLINGNLYILRDGKAYTATGNEL